ncbi:Hypothetical predicted protein, partial [Pelobates cultripes]
LYGTISKLELQHKQTQLANIRQNLTDARCRLKDLLTKRYYHSLQHSKNFFYIHANKGGKYLARILKGDVPRTRIHKIRLQSGKVSQFPEDIANEFQRYYHALYNLSGPEDTPVGHHANTLIQDYLHDNVGRRVSLEAANTLDEPISIEEMAAALKSAKA